MNKDDIETIKNDYNALSVDSRDNPIPLTFAKSALARTFNTSVSTSVAITLATTTSMIEVTAIDDSIFLKYGSTAVSNSNFDEFISVGATRHYVVPNRVTVINVKDNGGSGTVVIIEK